MWRAAGEPMGVAPGPGVAVAAYADYDPPHGALPGAACVFVERPHSRPGPAICRSATFAACRQPGEPGWPETRLQAERGEALWMVQ